MKEEMKRNENENERGEEEGEKDEKTKDEHHQSPPPPPCCKPTAQKKALRVETIFLRPAASPLKDPQRCWLKWMVLPPSQSADQSGISSCLSINTSQATAKKKKVCIYF